MGKQQYLTIDKLLKKIVGPNREKCARIYLDNFDLFSLAAGSSHNHQAWPGGYRDHIVETMNIAVILYGSLGEARPHPFTLSDALLVLFLHDLEKPFKHRSAHPYIGTPAESHLIRFNTKDDRRRFREAKLAEYGIILTSEQENGMQYVEGEGDDYTNKCRVMNELAAFCHLCDVWSARGWHGYPLTENDPWKGAKRRK